MSLSKCHSGLTPKFIHNATIKEIGKNQTASQVFLTAVSIVSSVACGSCSIGFTAAASSDLAYAQTGSLSAAVKAGATSAATTAVFYGIGEAFSATDGGFFQANSV